jgi:hypothetical protein
MKMTKEMEGQIVGFIISIVGVAFIAMYFMMR